jgi:hypothetical protein
LKKKQRQRGGYEDDDGINVDMYEAQYVPDFEDEEEKGNTTGRRDD